MSESNATLLIDLSLCSCNWHVSLIDELCYWSLFPHNHLFLVSEKGKVRSSEWNIKKLLQKWNLDFGLLMSSLGYESVNAKSLVQQTVNAQFVEMEFWSVFDVFSLWFIVIFGYFWKKDYWTIKLAMPYWSLKVDYPYLVCFLFRLVKAYYHLKRVKELYLSFIGTT